MSITSKAVRDLPDELEFSKQKLVARLEMFCNGCVWSVSENGTVAIPPRSLGFDLRSHPEPQLNQMLDLILIPKVHKVLRIGSRQVERTVIFTLEQKVSFSRHR